MIEFENNQVYRRMRLCGKQPISADTTLHQIVLTSSRVEDKTLISTSWFDTEPTHVSITMMTYVAICLKLLVLDFYYIFVSAVLLTDYEWLWPWMLN